MGTGKLLQNERLYNEIMITEWICYYAPFNKMHFESLILKITKNKNTILKCINCYLRLISSFVFIFFYSIMEFVPLFKIQFFDPSLRYLDPKSDVESTTWIRFHASLIKTYHIISPGSKYLSMGPHSDTWTQKVMWNQQGGLGFMPR
jgi:hypothetical protein